MINFNDVETKNTDGFASLPEGWYSLQVTDAILAQTQKGGQMIKTTLKVLGPTHAGRLIWNNFNLGATSLWALKGFLEKAGSDIINRDNVSESEIATNMVGLRIDAYLEPDSTTNGNPTNKIKNWRESASKPVAASAAAIASEPVKRNSFS